MIEVNLLPWREMIADKQKKWYRLCALLSIGSLALLFSTVHSYQKNKFQILQKQVQEIHQTGKKDFSLKLKSMHQQHVNLLGAIAFISRREIFSIKKITMDEHKIIMNGWVYQMSKFDNFVMEYNQKNQLPLMVQQIKKSDSQEEAFVEIVMQKKISVVGVDEL